MRNFILLLILVAAFTTTTEAQAIKVNAYTGYIFDDSFDSYYSSTSYLNGKILGNFQWGVGLEYGVKPEYGIEVLYYRMDTEAPINYWDNSDRSRVLDIGLNYIMLGGVRYMPVNDMFEGYGGLMVGMAIYDNKFPQSGEPNSVTKFAWGARLGANIWAHPKFGIKLQMQILQAVQAFGGSFYFGTGGSGAGVSTYSSLLQFGLGGGVVFRLGE